MSDSITGIGLTVYGDHETLAGDFAVAQPQIEKTKPQWLLLHASPNTLLREGADVQQKAEALGLDLQVGWQIAGDMIHQVDKWAEVAAAALDAGACCLSINAEGQDRGTAAHWYGRGDEGARAAIAALQPAADNGLIIAHTSFGMPMYHRGYPWSGFLGKGSPVSLLLPQVYWGEAGHRAPRGIGWNWSRLANSQWDEARQKGWCRSEQTRAIYLVGAGIAREDLCQVALCYPCAQVWSSGPSAHGDGLDREGMQALAAVAELCRRGYWRKSGIGDFQQDAGLTKDDLVGPKTLAALGLENL